MAANQTIIQAVEKGYTRPAIDYSGYLQGLSSISTMLIAKGKELAKNQTKLDEMIAGVDVDFEPQKDVMINYIDKANKSGVSNEIIGKNLKKLSKDALTYTAVNTDMGNIVKHDQMSAGVDPLLENYIRSFASGDFDEKYTITVDGKEKTFKIDFGYDENLNSMVVGPTAEYITPNELKSIIENMPRASHGDIIQEKIAIFNTYATNKKLTHKKEQFEENKDLAKTEINKILKRGVLDKNENVLISADNVKTSFMFDVEFEFGGKNVNFVDWYLSDKTLMPQEFIDAHKKFLDDYQPGDEIADKMKKLIAQDLIKYDDNLSSPGGDLDKFINELLQKHY